MEPRARIRCNLDTCKRGPPLIKLMGHEDREDALGVGGAGKGEHTHIYTHSVPRDAQSVWSLGEGTDAILTQVRVACPLIKILGYEHREDTVGGARNGKHNTHTQCPP